MGRGKGSGAPDLHIEVVDSRVDAQRVHPVPEGSLLPGLTWRSSTGNHITHRKSGREGGREGVRWGQTFNGAPVNVLVFGFFQGRVLVEEVGHEGKVQLGIPSHHIGRHDELPAAQPLSLLQHGLGPLQVILLLQGEALSHSLTDWRKLPHEQMMRTTGDQTASKVAQ